MNLSTRSRRRPLLKSLTAAALLLAATASLPLYGEDIPQSPDALRAAAIQSIKAGEFDKGTSLLEQARSIPGADSTLLRFAKWAEEYDTQRKGFVEDRRKQFDKAVADVQKLVDAKSDEFAVDFSGRAYVLAEDKAAFTATPLIRGIVTRTSELAAAHEAAGQWIKAQRLYSDLTVIEPVEPKWKEKFKATTRRVRLLALYAPDVLKKQRAEDTKLVEELDKIIPPPTTRAAATTKPSSEDAAFKLDWHDNLKGIKSDMLWQSLIDVRSNYWRDVEFSTLIKGGLEGVRALLVTDGLTQTFPAIGDAPKRDAMLAKLDEFEKTLAAAPKGTEVLTSSQVYRKLMEANKQTVGLPEEVLVYEFADGAFSQCDPFSTMIWPYDVDDFNKQTQGEFSGVGVQIQSDDDGSLRVVSPLEDSPAFRAGIKTGDVITHVDGKVIKGITTDQAARIITGPAGTPVTLTVKSFDGSTRDYTLNRQTIKVASLKGFIHKPGGGWNYFIDEENHIAYLRITNFTRTTGDELEMAAAELKKQNVRGIILDLRYNPGGLLTAAIDVVNRFIDKGVIVSTRADRLTPQQPTVATARPDPDEVKVPLVVMVNQYSASASEIVSGALKDQGRAVIVGERSFGKGSVQMLFPVDNHTAYLKLTTSHYYLPSGRCLHRDDNSTVWGVDPDVKVEMTPEQMVTAQRVRSELDILRNATDNSNGTEAPPSPAATPAGAEPTTKPIAKTPEDLIKNDNQLGAALLLLRLQLNGAEVAIGTPAPGVNAQAK